MHQGRLWPKSLTFEGHSQEELTLLTTIRNQGYLHPMANTLSLETTYIRRSGWLALGGEGWQTGS